MIKQWFFWNFVQFVLIPKIYLYAFLFILCLFVFIFYYKSMTLFTLPVSTTGHGQVISGNVLFTLVLLLQLLLIFSCVILFYLFPFFWFDAGNWSLAELIDIALVYWLCCENRFTNLTLTFVHRTLSWSRSC